MVDPTFRCRKCKTEFYFMWGNRCPKCMGELEVLGEDNDPTL